jgi:hypothetical protein
MATKDRMSDPAIPIPKATSTSRGSACIRVLAFKAAFLFGENPDSAGLYYISL